MSDEIVIDPKSSSRTMEKLAEFRLVGSVQGAQVLGPILQQAHRCREDGKIEWHMIPTQMVGIDEYLRIAGAKAST